MLPGCGTLPDLFVAVMAGETNFSGSVARPTSRILTDQIFDDFTECAAAQNRRLRDQRCREPVAWRMGNRTLDCSHFNETNISSYCE